jgi:hypothetical protein
MFAGPACRSGRADVTGGNRPHELTDNIVGPKAATLPALAFVFSSVFKEPKLWHAPGIALGVRPGVGADGPSSR